MPRLLPRKEEPTWAHDDDLARTRFEAVPVDGVDAGPPTVP
jgi:hypothetical protein